MKIKTLAIAAATLAVGAITSQAQVYSQNVVGYVNIISPANAFVPMANPVDLDGVDNLTNVLKNVPNGTTVNIWNGSGYTVVSKALFGGAWSANAATNYLTPGVGFFLKTPSNQTNTFTGTVIPNFPGTNSLALAANVSVFIGSVVPYSGTLSNAVDQGVDTLNLGSSLPKGSTVSIWNGSGYSVASKGLFNGLWSTNFTLTVGQGFFVKPASATNWVQTLQ